MQEKSTLSFDVYRLDAANARLWRRKQIVKIAPKAFRVLHYLAEHPGQLVTKAELFEVVWPETVVTDSSLTVCIKEVRKALHDNPQCPQYIETVHRRGYRFIREVARSQYSVVSSRPSLPPPVPRSSTLNLVGREAELAQLQGWLAKALSGERQVVFVTGEAGIGKTTLVNTFLVPCLVNTLAG
jgi:DNA-binding winged helix-turn-helix (wHTH) protein